MSSFPKPIVSTRSDDPDLDDRIDGFVVSLGERVDALQDAESAGDLALLRSLASALHDEADALGYPPLADAAARLEQACNEQGSEALRKLVSDLTELSQRVRRGHRSAAG